MILHDLQFALSVLTIAISGFLGFLYYSASVTNPSRFTTLFLKVLCLCSLARAWEVASSAYRTYRIDAANVPIDALAVGVQGRFFEMASYCFLIWFMLRPETKKALNGVKSQEQPNVI
jgi:hypothetical protein